MSTIKPPSAAIRAEFIEELSLTSRKLRTLFDARVRAKGLTLARARTLLHLARRDGVTQTELAELLEIEGPTLVRLLDGLEKQGLTERRPVEGDRRAKQIALTKAGRKLASDVTRIGDELREDVLSDIAEADMIAATKAFRIVVEKIAAMAERRTDAA